MTTRSYRTGTAAGTRPALQGLVAVPTPPDKTDEMISNAMRAGRAQMIEKHGAASVQKAINEASAHMDRINNRGIRA
jgi:hypothetical protein